MRVPFISPLDKDDKSDRAWLSTYQWPKPVEHIAVEKPDQVVLEWPQVQAGDNGGDEDMPDGAPEDRQDEDEDIPF